MNRSAFSRQFLPEVTVDVALLAIASDGALRTLLSPRTENPFQGTYALPGVFVGRSEGLEAAAARALEEKGGLTGVFLEQLETFGDPSRDPRGRILSVAFYALVPLHRFESALAHSRAGIIADVVVPWPGEQGGAVRAFDLSATPLALAFDHAQILGAAIKRVRGKLNYAPIGFELLSDEFTLADLQHIHEAILARKVNKDSFRRRMLASGLIEDTKTRRTDAAHRPAALYRFKKEEYRG